MTDKHVYLNRIIEKSHGQAVRSGWWHDLDTGNKKDRNKGELLCLIHSEISEGFDFDNTGGGNDDKLPHRLGAEVELADALIRLADYAGAFKYHMVYHDNFEDKFNPTGYLSWCILHSLVSELMEAERKNGDVQQAINNLASGIVSYSKCRNFDLFGAIEEKLEFNAVREDHKIENRKTEFGKKF